MFICKFVFIIFPFLASPIICSTATNNFCIGMPSSSSQHQKQIDVTKKVLAARRKRGTTLSLAKGGGKKDGQSSSTASSSSASHQRKQSKPIEAKPVVLLTDPEGNQLAAFFRQKFAFSNFHPSPIRVAGGQLEFHCVEQFFMYQKARVFGDEKIAREILDEAVPAKIKGLGRRVRNFDPQQWDPLSILAMTIGTFLKFEQNDGLKRELIGTGDAMIVEASPFDDRWGIGVGMTDLKKGKPWRGKNLLGKILTAVRDKLKEDPDEEEDNKVSTATIVQQLKLNNNIPGHSPPPVGASHLFNLATKKSLDIAVQILSNE